MQSGLASGEASLSDTSAIAHRFGALLTAQMARWEPLSLAAIRDGEADGPEAGFQPFAPALLRFAAAHRAELAAWLETARGPGEGSPQAPERVLRRMLVGWLRQRNQFLAIDAATEGLLDDLYTTALREAVEVLSEGGEVEPRLREGAARHRIRLRRALGALSAGAPDVPCEQYAPELQLAVLGLDAAEIEGPVLDLGCGREAPLVAALRAQGVAALGLDRDLAPGAPGIEGDWLRSPLGTKTWGTILSHLGFSLHFLHQHLSSTKGASTYAARTLEILAALRPGGLFAYAPGLPFFESVLAEAGFSVRRLPLPAHIAGPLDAAFAPHTGAPVAYATHVGRAPLWCPEEVA